MLMFLLTGCVKDSSINTQKTTVTFNDTFEAYWNGMNKNYLFWDLDKTNWDLIYQNYKPKFQKLDINNITDQQTSIKYFKEITAQLIDCHYSIAISYPHQLPISIYPSATRYVNSTNYHLPYIYYNIDSSYLDVGFVKGNYITSDQQNIFAMTGTIKHQILYFTCSQFGLQEAFTANSSNGVKLALQRFFANVDEIKQANYKGVIIDVRNNPGGNNSDLNFFVGKLINTSLFFGYTKYKSASGRFNYTPWIKATISPSTTNYTIQIPIIVLADNYSKSLSELVTMAIRALPKSFVIGEPTWGATGSLDGYGIYNDGSFTIGTTLNIYEASNQFKYIDGKSYEGIGFPPDQYIPYNEQELASGRDEQLEAAITKISSQ